jgi:hypothetical protein
MTEPSPIAEFRAMPRNTRWYAEYRLRTGARHPTEHFVIAARLDAWAKRVEEAGAEAREWLLIGLTPEGNA